MVPGSEKMLAKSFLGQVFLNDVYAADHKIREEEFTLFITEDSSGRHIVGARVNHLRQLLELSCYSKFVGTWLEVKGDDARSNRESGTHLIVELQHSSYIDETKLLAKFVKGGYPQGIDGLARWYGEIAS